MEDTATWSQTGDFENEMEINIVTQFLIPAVKQIRNNNESINGTFSKHTLSSFFL